MDYEGIRKDVDACYKQIQDANEMLEKLRNTCDHPTTEEKDYMWRIAATVKAKMCTVCDKVISTPFDNMNYKVETNSDDDDDQYTVYDLEENNND